MNAARPFWEQGRVWLLLALVSALPFVVAPMPVMPDHFAHVARYHVMLNRDGSAFLQQYFSVEWALIGNLGVDLLMTGLGRVLPVETAATVAVALIPMLTVAGIYALARAVHGRVPATALFALMMVWTYTFLWGFENYHLSLALALLCAAAWIRLDGAPGWQRWLLMAPFSCLVWLAHVSGWGVMGLFVLGWEMAQRAQRASWRELGPAMGRIVMRMLPLALPAMVMLVWRQGADGSARYLPSGLGTKLRYGVELLRAELIWLDLVLIGVLVVAALWMLWRLWPHRNQAMVMATGWQLLAYLLMPYALFGSYFADQRLLPAVGIAFFLALGVPDRKTARRLAMLALALFVVKIGEISWGWRVRGQMIEAELVALEQIPQGSRVAAMARMSNCTEDVLHGYDHIANFVITRRDGFANTQWDVAGGQLVRPLYNRGRGYNDENSVHLGDPRDRKCYGLALDALVDGLPRDRFDFVWTFDAPVKRDWLTPVFEGKHGRLYRVSR